MGSAHMISGQLEVELEQSIYRLYIWKLTFDKRLVGTDSYLHVQVEVLRFEYLDIYVTRNDQIIAHVLYTGVALFQIVSF